MDSSIITLQQLLNKNKTFVIPEYQRGYVWGKKRFEGETDSVTYILDDILKHFSSDSEMFLQGITITEKEKEIILIDGQQRTTFLFLLLKKVLEYEGNFTIRYEVRKESDNYLNNRPNEDNDFQDIYFFNKTLEIIKNKISDVDQAKLREFLLTKIKFLYIDIPENQAISVFTMMNGNRAKMKQEELIKAELLRISSLNTNDTNSSEEFYAKEWEDNELRSRFAREWDRWLRWWNQEEVVKLFNTENSYMGLLLTTYYDSNHYEDNKAKFSFETFRDTYLKESTPQQAKKTFLELRQLQKHFEDVYNKPVMYNKVGAILRILKKEDKNKFIRHIFVEGRNAELDNYYKLAFLRMNHKDITDKNKEEFKEKYDNTLNLLNEDLLYQRDTEFAFRFLLRLNIDEDNKLDRKFDFDIWSNRSLEHIYSKSKVWHWNADETKKLISIDSNENNDVEIPDDKINKEFMHREDIKDMNGKTSTEHGIGNLVLLYKNENSSFNAGLFPNKKEKFFNPLEKDFFKSRNLLHTICVFAKYMDWTGKSIVNNKLDIISKFEEDYKQLREDFKYEQD